MVSNLSNCQQQHLLRASLLTLFFLYEYPTSKLPGFSKKFTSSERLAKVLPLQENPIRPLLTARWNFAPNEASNRKARRKLFEYHSNKVLFIK
jgi:hypothetical protein